MQEEKICKLFADKQETYIQATEDNSKTMYNIKINHVKNCAKQHFSNNKHCCIFSLI